MRSIATTVAEQLEAASRTAHDLARVAAGMSIVGIVFLIAQTLLFLEELWWRS